MATANGELQYFVGREDELQALRDFVADPSPGVLLVTGPPGIGKSFLLRKFIQELRESVPGARTVWGRVKLVVKGILKGQLPVALGKPIVVHHRLAVVWDPLGDSPQLVAIQDPATRLDYVVREIAATRYYELPAEAILSQRDKV